MGRGRGNGVETGTCMVPPSQPLGLVFTAIISLAASPFSPSQESAIGTPPLVLFIFQ